MKFKRKIAEMLMITCLFSLGLSAASIDDVPEEVQVSQMQKPRVVELYSPSCGHCRQMAPVYTRVAQKCKEGVHFYRVNVTTEEGMNIAGSIAPNVSGVPTFVFVDKNGQNTEEPKAGGMTEAELTNHVDHLL